MRLRHVLIVAVEMCFIASATLAQRATSPSEATVFIRVVGKLRAEYEGMWKESIEEKDIEIGTGSGFVISPYGHVLTNYHVISDEELTKTIRGMDIEIRLDVERIEVAFPPKGDDVTDSTIRFTASVDAVDPELDLAVLSVSGAALPYIPFGDSDATEPGDPVTVLGFPFGRKVEVGKTSVPDIVPQVSLSRGAASARRTGEVDRTEYIQTTATVNPGNSGGPMVDEEGYAVGVVRMKLVDASGIGFAISINVVKDFLEMNGLDQLLPVRRMRLGPYQNLEGKGLRLRFPDGLEDLSPIRVRVASAPSSEVPPLTIDRVASTWNLRQIEQALTSGQAFEPFSLRDNPQSSKSMHEGRALAGHANGVAPETAQRLKMEYAVFDLGGEKVVARFVGPDEQVAFNRSVLRASLQSMEIAPLLTDEIRQPLRVAWREVPLPSPVAPRVILPADWILEEGAPFPCPGLSPPDSAIITSPSGDFTVRLIAGWWREGPEAGEAALACSSRRGSLGAASYSSQAEWLGVSYRIEGIFVELGEGLLRLELVAPAEKYGFIVDMFGEWVDGNVN